MRNASSSPSSSSSAAAAATTASSAAYSARDAPPQQLWPAGGVAVLCRTRAQVAEVADALKAAGVRVERRLGAAGGGGGAGGAAEGDDGSLRSSCLDVLALVNLALEGGHAAAATVSPAGAAADGLGAAATDSDFETAAQLARLSPAATPTASTAAAAKLVAYLRAARGATAAPTGPSAPSAAARRHPSTATPPPRSLLSLARAALASGCPAVRSSAAATAASTTATAASSSAAAPPAAALSKALQGALRTFVALVDECRGRALRHPPHQVLGWLVGRVDLVSHLERLRKARDGQRRAFTIRVPGGDGGSNLAGGADSDDDDDDGEEEEEASGGVGVGDGGREGGGGWGRGGRASSSTAPPPRRVGRCSGSPAPRTASRTPPSTMARRATSRALCRPRRRQSR